jgi:hypothetical protein
VEISRLQRKEKYFKNTKTTAIRPKNGKLLAIIFVVFKYFPFSYKSLEISTPNSVFQQLQFHIQHNVQC